MEDLVPISRLEGDIFIGDARDTRYGIWGIGTNRTADPTTGGFGTGTQELGFGIY